MHEMVNTLKINILILLAINHIAKQLSGILILDFMILDFSMVL